MPDTDDDTSRQAEQGHGLGGTFASCAVSTALVVAGNALLGTPLLPVLAVCLLVDGYTVLKRVRARNEDKP